MHAGVVRLAASQRNHNHRIKFQNKEAYQVSQKQKALIVFVFIQISHSNNSGLFCVSFLVSFSRTSIMMRNLMILYLLSLSWWSSASWTTHDFSKRLSSAQMRGRAALRFTFTPQTRFDSPSYIINILAGSWAPSPWEPAEPAGQQRGARLSRLPTHSIPYCYFTPGSPLFKSTSVLAEWNTKWFQGKLEQVPCHEKIVQAHSFPSSTKANLSTGYSTIPACGSEWASKFGRYFPSLAGLLKHLYPALHICVHIWVLDASLVESVT